MPHRPMIIFTWKVTFPVNSTRQKKHLETVQGKFKPLKPSSCLISHILVGYQKSWFFISFCMKACMLQTNLILGLPNSFKKWSWRVAFLKNILGNLLVQFHPKYNKCVLFCYKYFYLNQWKSHIWMKFIHLIIL